MTNVNQKKPHSFFNPFEQLFERKPKNETSPQAPVAPQIEDTGGKSNGEYSQVDFEKLNKAYATQDDAELAKVREQLSPEDVKKQDHAVFFKKYKQEEEVYYETRKREEEEKKLAEERQKLEEQRQEQEALTTQQSEDTLPKGIIRKNILGGSNKKADLSLPPEMKPGGGKQ